MIENGTDNSPYSNHVGEVLGGSGRSWGMIHLNMERAPPHVPPTANHPQRIIS